MTTPKPPRLSEVRPDLSCPSDLRPDVLESWNYWAPLLDSLGLLRDVDAPALIVLCQTEAGIRQLSEDIRLNGATQTVNTRKGPRQIKRPQVRILKQYEQQYEEWLREFGIESYSRLTN